MLKLDFWNLVFTVINLLVLYLLLKKFLFGPVEAIMAKRKAMIEENLESARAAQAEADEMKRQYAERLETADETSKEIISKAKADACVEYDKMMAAADKKAEKVVENARRNMENEREKMMSDMQPEIAALALSAAAKVIEDCTSEAQNMALYDEFLAKEGGKEETGAMHYAKVLYEQPISAKSVSEAEDAFAKTPELAATLGSAEIAEEKKFAVIEKVFAGDIQDYLKDICKNGHMGMMKDIFKAYQKYIKEQGEIPSVKLSYVTAPSERQMEGIKEFLCQTYHCREVALELCENKALVGGFVLRTRDREYDWSIKGRISQLEHKLIRR